MALRPEDPYLGFHHDRVVAFINEKMAQHVRGPQFYRENMRLPWEQVEDKLQDVLGDRAVSREAKEACAWGGLALRVRSAQRQIELHQNKAKWWHNCANIQKSAAQTLASDLRELTAQRETERKEAAFQLQLAQAKLSEMRKEWDLLREKFLGMVRLSGQRPAPDVGPSPCLGPGGPKGLGSPGSYPGPSPSLGPGPCGFCPGLCAHLESDPCCHPHISPSPGFGAGCGASLHCGHGPASGPDSSHVFGPGPSFSLKPLISSSSESTSARPAPLHRTGFPGEKITQRPSLAASWRAGAGESEVFDLVTAALSKPDRLARRQEVDMGEVRRDILLPLGVVDCNSKIKSGGEKQEELGSGRLALSGVQMPESTASWSPLPVQLPASFTYSYSLPLTSFPADSSPSPPTVHTAGARPPPSFPWQFCDIPLLSEMAAHEVDPPRSQRQRKGYEPHLQRRA